jgi:hypothetical protein
VRYGRPSRPAATVAGPFTSRRAPRRSPARRSRWRLEATSLARGSKRASLRLAGADARPLAENRPAGPGAATLRSRDRTAQCRGMARPQRQGSEACAPRPTRRGRMDRRRMRAALPRRLATNGWYDAPCERRAAPWRAAISGPPARPPAGIRMIGSAPHRGSGPGCRGAMPTTRPVSAPRGIAFRPRRMRPPCHVIRRPARVRRLGALRCITGLCHNGVFRRRRGRLAAAEILGLRNLATNPSPPANSPSSQAFDISRPTCRARLASFCNFHRWPYRRRVSQLPHYTYSGRSGETAQGFKNAGSYVLLDRTFGSSRMRAARSRTGWNRR